MADTTITVANSVFTIMAAGLFPAPVQLAGYSVEKAFTNEAVDMTEEQMGVDGRMTAGFIFMPVPMTVSLQADSPSKVIFTAIVAAQKTARDIYWLSGSIQLPSLGESYTLTRGVLKTPKQMPDANKVAAAMDFKMVWERIDRAIL